MNFFYSCVQLFSPLIFAANKIDVVICSPILTVPLARPVPSYVVVKGLRPELVSINYQTITVCPVARPWNRIIVSSYNRFSTICESVAFLSSLPYISSSLSLLPVLFIGTILMSPYRILFLVCKYHLHEQQSKYIHAMYIAIIYNIIFFYKIFYINLLYFVYLFYIIVRYSLSFLPSEFHFICHVFRSYRSYSRFLPGI